MQVGLVHALILAQVDAERLTDQANLLEEALGNARRYRAASIASLDTLAPTGARADFPAALRDGLVRMLEMDWAFPPAAHEAPA